MLGKEIPFCVTASYTLLKIIKLYCSSRLLARLSCLVCFIASYRKRKAQARALKEVVEHVVYYNPAPE